MKNIEVVLVQLVIVLFLFACDQSDFVKQQMRLIRVESKHGKIELTYDDKNRISSSTRYNYTTSDTTLSPVLNFFYTSQDTLEKCIDESSKAEYRYIYKDNKLVRTNKYYDDKLSEYFIFNYDETGRISYTGHHYVGLPQSTNQGGSGNYVYDLQHNLIRINHYYNISGPVSGGYTEFSVFDTKIAMADPHNPVSPWYPLLQFGMHNPRKKTRKDQHGATIENVYYKYTYNKSGYVTWCAAISTDSPRAQYVEETNYFYEEVGQ
jgi:hypothetical protein